MAALAHALGKSDPVRRAALYRLASADDSLSGACSATGQALADDPALGRELLRGVRARIFAALEAGALPPDSLIAFVQAIRSVDPAAARFALERGITDCGFYVVPKATLLGWLATLDTDRALELAGAMENPEWRDAAQLVIGAYLLLDRPPTPLASGG